MSLCDRYWRQQKYIVYRGWLLSLKRIFELFCIMVVLCVPQCKLLWGILCGKCNRFCFNNLSKEIIKSLRISRDMWFIECLKFRCVRVFHGFTKDLSYHIYFPFPFPFRLLQFIFPQYSSNFCQYKCSRYTQINFIEIEIQFWPYISRYMDSNLGTNQFNSNEIQTWPPVELGDILLHI